MPPELHPALSPAEREARLERGIRHFNQGRYFDAHEEWEEIWRSTTPEPRDLFQGLIQVAVGLYHWQERGRRGPAARVLARGLVRLEGLAEREEGVRVDELRRQARAWLHWWGREAGSGGAPPPRPRIVREACSS